jgi:hypothetical protein
MVTGKIPYEGSSPAEIMARHLKDPVPEPHEANRALDMEICTIIQRMMAKNPDDRYANMEEVETALGEYVAKKTQPVPSRGSIPSRAAPSREPAAVGESNAPVKAGLIVGLSIVFAAAILALVAWWGLSSLRPGMEMSSDGAEPPASEGEKAAPAVPQARQFETVLVGANGGTRRLPAAIRQKTKTAPFLYAQDFATSDGERLPDGVECYLMGWSSGRRTTVDSGGVELENLSAGWQIEQDEVDESKKYLRMVLGPESIPPSVSFNARFDFPPAETNQNWLLAILLRSGNEPGEVHVRLGSESQTLQTLQVNDRWNLFLITHSAKPEPAIVFLTLSFGGLHEVHVGGVWIKPDPDGAIAREAIPSSFGL